MTTMFKWATSFFKSTDSEPVKEEFVQKIDDDLQADSNIAGEEIYSAALNIEDLDINLTTDILVLIVKDLSIYEKVSLVFLLDNIPDHALQTLKIGFANELHLGKAISDWARSEETWRNKFLEALTIIQNYEVIEKIGYSKNDVLHFLMFHKETKLVDRIRKELYLICESFTYSEAENFISLVKEDTIKIEKFEHFQKLWGIELNKLLEICFLQMLSCRYIINEDENINLKKLNTIFKKMDKLDLADKLDDIVRTELKQRLKQSNLIINKKDSLEYYPIIDKKRLGLFIVINQVKFGQDHLKLFPLDEREGSEKDIDALKTTFETNLKMNFILLENIPSHEIVEKIRDSLKKFEPEVHSMLFVCLLSHGYAGSIYGTDGKAVELDDLQKCLAELKSLKGKPKVMIVQACQNELPESKKDIVTDGLCLDYTDFLVCMSTLKGLTAYRNKKEGTWYIQSLCKNVDQYKSQKHFSDILTQVHNDIDSSIEALPSTEPVKQIPYLNSTLKKYLYLQTPSSS